VKASNRRCYRATPKGKDTTRRNNASEVSKQNRRQYEASDVGMATRRQYAASDGRKQSRRQYEASEGRKEKRKQYDKQYDASEGRLRSRMGTSAPGNKRARVFLEACDNGKRPAVQQKTNGPQLGSLGALLGGS
jgi:hypothetical protein